MREILLINNKKGHVKQIFLSTYTDAVNLKITKQSKLFDVTDLFIVRCPFK